MRCHQVRLVRVLPRLLKNQGLPPGNDSLVFARTMDGSGNARDRSGGDPGRGLNNGQVHQHIQPGASREALSHRDNHLLYCDR